MIFCDTHAHLYAEEFDNDRDQMIHRAVDKGVKYLFLPNIDSTTVAGMNSLAEKYPENCFPMMGLHPTSVKENYREELNIVEKHLSKGKYCAIGEVGIDLYWDKTFAKEQEEVFLRQVELSVQYDIPLVLHTRNSMDRTIELLEPYRGRVRGIFHCFGESSEHAKAVTGLGFLLGIGGIITYKNSGIEKVIEETDLEYLVLETDAPYLTPSPHRGKRNESSYIPYVAEVIAAWKNIPLEVVAEVTTRSAMELFGINPSK